MLLLSSTQGIRCSKQEWVLSTVKALQTLELTTLQICHAEDGAGNDAKAEGG